MAEQVEISSLDLRFEGYRLRNKAAERVLLASISENGIRDPLHVVDTKDCPILLDGFKRCRCAKKLGIGIASYCSLAEDAGVGIIELLRMSNAKSLSILEQARLIDELKGVYQMSTKDIAQYLEKSKAWVSVRSGIASEMSPVVTDRIFKGQFPVYAYMYILRPFIRINKFKTEQIDEFVNLVAGKGLSIRDIERLAHGYFKGSDEFRRQIRDGNILWGLNSLKDISEKASACTKIEQAMLKELELVQKYMQRVTFKSNETRYKTEAFFAQANLLTGGILSRMEIFSKAVRQFHDKSGKTQRHLVAAQPRHGGAPNQPPFQGGPQHRARDHKKQGPNA